MPAFAAGTSLRSPARAAAVAAACLLAANAGARDFEIGYHERIALPRAATAPRVSFVAHGRQFDLELQSNAGIVAMPEAAGATAIALYRGRLVGHPGSWVRLSETGEKLSGVIFDGTELWLIDTYASVADFLITPEANTQSGPVIFRLGDVAGDFADIVVSGAVPRAAANMTQTTTPAMTPTTEVAATHSTMPGTLQAATGFGPLLAAASVGELPGRVIDIGLIASADFAQRHGAAAHAVLLEMFNIVEGIYLTQVGVQLRAVEIAVLEADPVALQGTAAAQLLENFGVYKLSTPALNPLGLAHLFVARDLLDTNPPIRTVGIANLGVLCDQRFGVGITEAIHATTFDALIAAHEIGHNFGAPHDAQTGSACAAEPERYIMAPQINGGARFSQCSIEQMQPEIAAAACMREIPPADLQLRTATAPPASVIESEAVGFDVVLSNLSSTRVAGLELTASASGFSTPRLNTYIGSGGYCNERPSLQCVWPWFEAGASVTLSLSATGTRPGPGNIAVAVNSLNELDTSDNALSFEVEVVPLNDLTSRLSPERLVLHPGDTARFSASVANYGAAAASDVVVHVDIGGGGLELVDIGLPDCRAGPRPRSFECAIGSLGALAVRSFGFTVRVPDGSSLAAAALDGHETVSVLAASNETPPEQAHRASAAVTVGAQVADLSVTIAGPNRINTGESGTWRIDVINFGPDAASGVRISDAGNAGALPDGTQFIAATRGECTLAGSAFECTIPTLEAGESAAIELTSMPQMRSGTYHIAARVESAAPDSDAANDSSALQVAVGSFAASGSTNLSSNSEVSLSGSGGGSLDLFALAGLGALLGLRRRRLVQRLSVRAHHGQCAQKSLSTPQPQPGQRLRLPSSFQLRRTFVWHQGQ